MRALVVLPHRDPTIALVPPQGWTLVDAASAFARRAASAETLRAVAEPVGSSDEALQRALWAKAAQALLRRGAADDLHASLRVLGASFTALSRSPSSVHLRLDDLELASGTTEKTADVVIAASGLLPFEREIENAVDSCAFASVVALWVERDQELPAALAFAALLPESIPLQLWGTFASTHRAALAKLFPRAEFTSGDSVGRLLQPPPGYRGEVPLLRWRAEGSARPQQDWAGSVALAELERELASGCRTAVVAFAALRDDAVLGIDGRWYPRAELERAREKVELVGELWVGAPGVTRDQLTETIERCARSPFSRVVGARRFHWSRGRGPFLGAEVLLSAPPAERDLARALPFTAPGTLAEDEVLPMLDRAARALVETGQASPGRVALSYVMPPLPRTQSGSRIALDRECAVVSHGPAWYAVNLRTAATVAIDARIAPALAKLEVPAPPEAALPGVPAAQREKLCRALIDRRILAEVEP